MWLVVGLGNPGREYANTRHNAGFLVVDRLSRKNGIPVRRKLRGALVGEGVLAGQRVALAKPQTYMNLSGQAVAGLVHWYKLSPSEVIVVYDDKDLPPGRIRVRPRGGPAGHRGMTSVLEALGTREVARVRVGIGREPAGAGEDRGIGYVLSPFAKEERPLVEEALERAAEAVETILAVGVEQAMQRFNYSPPASPAESDKSG
ncbi:MAG: aminoacyl-tRNA hydrolase [Bacillota bacterium]|nr:aminoacyl-tRNA hydrolase [Bacillota bacterium]